MAFDGGSGVGGGGGGSDAMTFFVARLKTMRATTDALLSATALLGTPSDVPALRGKLDMQAKLGQRQCDEIESMLLKYREEGQAGKSRLASTKAFKTLEEDYGALKRSLLEAARPYHLFCSKSRSRQSWDASLHGPQSQAHRSSRSRTIRGQS